MGSSRRTRPASDSPAPPPPKSPTMASDCVVCRGRERQSTSKAASDVWVQCENDECREWSHWDCVAPSPDESVDAIDTWYCSRCIERSKRNSSPFEITYKEVTRKTARKTTKLNYRNLDSGLEGDPGRWYAVANSRPMKPNNFRRMRGNELTYDWIMSEPAAMLEPIIIESPDGLGMAMPERTMTVRDVAQVVGSETPVEVMDVASQNSLAGWTLGRWAEYFHDPERNKIRNVISLEVSDTPLSARVIPPKIVRDIDWIETIWPPEFKQVGYYPKVQKYCLMSVADCWTDWHIDFAASSVYYHILSGAKTFFFIRPTPENLHKYEKWSGDSRKQEMEWLGDSVDAVYRVDLVAGNTMIIPSGWIHSVYTPKDALVFGGNFLHSLNIGTQLRVHEIEKKTKVPMKYRFPHFITFLWFVADHYLAKLEQSLPPESSADAPVDPAAPPAKLELHPDLTPRILTGLKFLSLFLLEQASRFLPGSEATPDEKKWAAKNKPDIIVDPVEMARRFRASILLALGETETSSAAMEAAAAAASKKRKAPTPTPVPAVAAPKFRNFEAPASKKAKTDQTSEQTERRDPIIAESRTMAPRPLPDGVEDGPGPAEDIEVRTMTTETRVTRVVRSATTGKVVRERRTVTTVVERMVWEGTEGGGRSPSVNSPVSSAVPSPASAHFPMMQQEDVKPVVNGSSPLTWRNEQVHPRATGTNGYSASSPASQGGPAPPRSAHRASALPPPPAPRQPGASAAPSPTMPAGGQQWMIGRGGPAAPAQASPTSYAPYYGVPAPPNGHRYSLPPPSSAVAAPQPGPIPNGQELHYSYLQPAPAGLASTGQLTYIPPMRSPHGTSPTTPYGIPSPTAPPGLWTLHTPDHAARSA